MLCFLNLIGGKDVRIALATACNTRPNTLEMCWRVYFDREKDEELAGLNRNSDVFISHFIIECDPKISRDDFFSDHVVITFRWFFTENARSWIMYVIIHFLTYFFIFLLVSSYPAPPQSRQLAYLKNFIHMVNFHHVWLFCFLSVSRRRSVPIVL